MPRTRCWVNDTCGSARRVSLRSVQKIRAIESVSGDCRPGQIGAAGSVDVSEKFFQFLVGLEEVQLGQVVGGLDRAHTFAPRLLVDRLRAAAKAYRLVISSVRGRHLPGITVSLRAYLPSYLTSPIRFAGAASKPSPRMPLRQAPLTRARIRRTMISKTHSAATAAGANTGPTPTPGRRALIAATPPKQMAVRDVPMVSRETR